MRIQNLAIIFLVIMVPLILVLSYYLDLQQDSLKMQTDYDTKLADATKEGIRAFEINTVEWSEWKSRKTRVAERNDVQAAINSFTTSLANNLNISGTAKEYMFNYIPAVAMTMYDGYYIYSANYVPITIKNDEGVDLYYDEFQGILTEDSSEGANPLAYKPKDTTKEYVTDIDEAETEYKHFLSSQIAYINRYKSTNTDLVINYTLDNRIYLYGKVNGNNIYKEGYLTYFENDTVLPKVTINNNNITVNQGIADIKYSNGDIKTKIEPEVLEEQILYKDNNNYYLKTFKYIYDIEHQKLYYDQDNGNFFIYKEATAERQFLTTNAEVGKAGCKYKSISILVGDNEYIKLYQVLNGDGDEKGKWYANLNEDSDEFKNEGIEGIDKPIDVSGLGLTGYNIYTDYSAISYYVEAYAFTNWVDDNLGNITVKVNEIDKNIFKITEQNNPEKEDSPIVVHKKEVIKENIITNLNAAISNYSNGTYVAQLPVLTDNDWDQIFRNISMLTFFQGVPIGIKTYNNYAIATSTSNREFVDPSEIYFCGSDTNYHRPYCSKLNNEDYTGYRSIEYILRSYTDTESGNNYYYYQHDNYNQSDGFSETACYYCIINRANYNEKEGKNENSIKSYYEALARERYYQKETIRYNP